MLSSLLIFMKTIPVCPYCGVGWSTVDWKMQCPKCCDVVIGYVDNVHYVRLIGPKIRFFQTF